MVAMISRMEAQIVSKQQITLWVNGIERQAQVGPKTTLLSILRDQLGLTGTKNGCGTGHCGACTVIVEGRATRSCVYRAERAAGKRVETIEGLAQGGDLHPLQQAFVQEGAVQCGFCTPGMIMAAKALLDANLDPTEAEIKQALRHNLCRCTGYEAIIRAVRAAAAMLRGESYPSAAPEVMIGGSHLRPDAVPKVTGKAKYAADYVFQGMAHAKVLRSAHPHARLLDIDSSAAERLPGVLAVLTAKDVPGVNRHGLERPDWPVLCEERVRYVGDAVAVVVAETEAIAERALEQIAVEYEPLPVLDTPEAALAPDAMALHPDGNIAEHIALSRGDLERGFAEADLVLERTYRTARAEHAFLEPEASVATVDGHNWVTVYCGTQIPFEDQRQVAEALGLPRDQVRVVHTETGGTFGGKEDIAGQIHAALAAWVTRRPVKLVYTRTESIVSHPKRHPTTIRLKTGARRDGTLVALEAEIVGDTGAYASLGPYVMTRTATHATGPYQVPNVRIDCNAVYTNNIPGGAFRGFGVPQSAFAIESQLDLLAAELGLSPWEIRRINALRNGSRTATGQVLGQDVGLLATLDAVQAAQRDAEQRQGPELSEGKRRAWGLACAYKNVGLGGGAPDKAGAFIEIGPSGRVLVKAGAAEVGQGLVAVLAQIVAQELGVAYGQIDVLVGDTDLTLDGGATTASRQTFITGNAARLAAIQLRQTLADLAADAWGVSTEQVVWTVQGAAAAGRPQDALTWKALYERAEQAGVSLRVEHVYEAPATRPLGQGGDMHFAFGYATQAAEVEVDVATGEVRVLQVIAAHDVGKAINPLGVRGQIEGGVVMGMGLGLTEELPMEGGQPLATNLGQYKLVRAPDKPEIVPLIVEAPIETGPYGAKGVGEIPSIPTAAAIANAIYAACGARVYAIPATPERVLAALAGATG